MLGQTGPFNWWLWSASSELFPVADSAVVVWFVDWKHLRDTILTVSFGNLLYSCMSENGPRWLLLTSGADNIEKLTVLKF